MASAGPSFVVSSFADDVCNAVCDYCADGIDAFDKCLSEAPLLEPEVVQQIREGTERLGNDLLDRMEPNLALFQQLCTMAVFHVPDHVRMRQDVMPLASPARAPSKSEQELDATLDSLRAQLQEVGEERAQLQADVARLDEDIKQHGHLAAHTAALASTLHVSSAPAAVAGSSQDGQPQQQQRAGHAGTPEVAASVAAIAAGMLKLQPLLLKAQKLRSQRQPLAALQDAAVAVEVKTSQLTKSCGTLEDLQALKSLLQPTGQGHA